MTIQSKLLSDKPKAAKRAYNFCGMSEDYEKNHS